jgi:tetratricopeptide (TPR) repeat protein
LDILRYDAPENRLNRPDRLVGRDELAERVHRLLDDHERVMLHGLAGTGKTALAATIADQRVARDKGPYLWLRPGNADAETVLDGIVRALASPEEGDRIAAAVGDARLHAIRGMLAGSGIQLWVVDDVWHPQVLHTLLRALPDRVGVVVTSRLKIDVGQLVEVAELAPQDAVALLNLHAHQTVSAAADELCRELGYHAYALEIAGRHLRQYETTAKALSELLHDAPHALAMPGGFAAPGRESVQRLLDRSCEALESEDARNALSAISAFSSGTASAELLSVYLGLDLARTRQAVNRLVDVSLAKPIPGTSGYSVHDLTYAYARSTTAGDERIVAAITRFVGMYSRNYPLLALEMDNLLAVAADARTRDPAAFLTVVEVLATGGYLDDYGHTLGLLRLLDEAIELVRAEPERHHVLLTKRGNAAYNQGEHELAIRLYVRALDTAPNPQRRIILMSLIGKVLAELGRHDEAEEQFKQAYALADPLADKESRLRILEQHSVAAFRRRDYEKVRDLTREGLDLSRLAGARFQEAVFLNNLGTAEFELGVGKAIELHTQALELAADMDNDHLRALTHRTLGADYQAQERWEQAREHFLEALRLYGKLGQNTRQTNLRWLMTEFGYLDK